MKRIKGLIRDYRYIAEQIFLAGVESVLPDRLIGMALKYDGHNLGIGNRRFNLDRFKHVFVTGAGKGGALMGAGLEEMLGSRIAGGHIIVKYGHSCGLERIGITEAGHPLPDSNGFRAAEIILKISEEAGREDLVIFLISGGGSALLPDFPPGSNPEEMIHLNDLLVKSGATIQEINAVRKHLSRIKGGQLARCVYPAALISLIISDVPGDPPDVIASGPTVPDPSTFRDAVAILSKYELTGTVPRGLQKYLADGVSGQIPETPKTGDPCFEKTFTDIIGNNRMALAAASAKAKAMGIESHIMDDKIEGDVCDVAEYIVNTALHYREITGIGRPYCLLFGGEPTIKVTGAGRGGRNQHLALCCAILLRNTTGITVLSAGTDGTDGPTNAAGAVVDSETYRHAMKIGFEPGSFLQTFDSYNFFLKAGGHIITGPTMTNVMDIAVVIVE